MVFLFIFSNKGFGQGTIAFGTAVQNSNGLIQLPVVWSSPTSTIGQISGLNVSVSISGGTIRCIEQLQTTNSRATGLGLNYPPSTSTINCSIAMGPFFGPTPSSPVVLYILHYTATAGSSTTLNFGARQYSQGGIKTIGGGFVATIGIPTGVTISGFIERPGTPAPQCVNVPNAGIPNVDVAITSTVTGCLASGGTASTAGTGNYTTTGRGSLDYTITPSKNTGRSCGVTSLDAGMITTHILGSVLFSDNQQYYAADCNQNNIISTADVTMINQIINNIQPQAPYVSWDFAPTSSFVSLQFPVAAPPNFNIITHVTHGS